MIKFLLFLLIVAVFVIYFVLIIARGIMRALHRSSRPSSGYARQETPPKPKEDYKDVQDAKFIELSDEKKEEEKSS